jgi:glutamate-ammonia-ligase adenylyltransferase
VIAGSPGLAGAVRDVIRHTLCRQVAKLVLREDARHMRRRVAQHSPAKGPFDLKFAPGGLMDIDFTAQLLQLQYAPADPAILAQGSQEVLARLKSEKILSEPEAIILATAAELQLALLQVLRIAVDGPLDPDAATPGLKALLARACGVARFENLQRLLCDLQTRAHAVFVQHVGE